MDLSNEKINIPIAKKLYDEDWFIWLSFAFFPPLGLFLMWRKEKYTLLIRIVLSISGFIWFLMGIIFFSALSPSKTKISELETTNLQLVETVEEMQILNSDFQNTISDNNNIIIELKKELVKQKSSELALNTEFEKLSDENIALIEEVAKLEASILALEATPSAVGSKAKSSDPITEASSSEEISKYSGMITPDSVTFSRNENGSVSITGKPNTEYIITVYYSSGPSKAQGLESKTSNDSGHVSWNWKIGGRTNPGSFRIIISGGGETIEIPLLIV